MIAIQDLNRLEQELIAFVYQHYLGQKWRGENLPKQFFQSLAAHVRHLSDGFTVDRKELRTGYVRLKEYRSAYLLYFHLANVTRTAAVLDEMQKRGLLPNRELDALDVGAATAPSLWALALFGDVKLGSAEAWDKEKGILHDARALWDQFSHIVKKKMPPLKTAVVDLNLGVDGRGGKKDIIFFSNVLNELPPHKDDAFLRTLQTFADKKLKDDGKIVILEPALLHISKRLTLIRDRIVTQGLFVPAPCSHNGMCPLNYEPKDWCHFEVEWKAPDLRYRLQKTLEHKGRLLKYSYLVIQKQPVELKNNYRVLSEPLDSRVGNCVLLCAPDKKVALFYNYKSGPYGEMLAQIQRGDLLEGNIPPEKPNAKVRFNRFAYEIDAAAEMKLKKL